MNNEKKERRIFYAVVFIGLVALFALGLSVSKKNYVSTVISIFVIFLLAAFLWIKARRNEKVEIEVPPLFVGYFLAFLWGLITCFFKGELFGALLDLIGALLLIPGLLTILFFEPTKSWQNKIIEACALLGTILILASFISGSVALFS